MYAFAAVISQVFSESSRDLIRGMLNKDPDKRLGSSERDGDEIREVRARDGCDLGMGVWTDGAFLLLCSPTCQHSFWGRCVINLVGIRNLLPDFDRSPKMLPICIRAPGLSRCRPFSQHIWFKTIDWEKLEKRELKPPFVPNVAGEIDTSNHIAIT